MRGLAKRMPLRKIAGELLGAPVKHRLIAAAACGLLMTVAAQSAEITALSSGAVREIVTDLLPQFEKSSGHKVAVTWSGTAKIKQQIGGGETYDLVIVGAPVIDDFIKAGKVRPSSRVDLVRSGVGVAVKAGAPKPDISSAAAVKNTLLAAKSVAYSTGPSGVYVQALFEKLGIADQMKPKSKQTVSGTRVGEYLVRGEAELGFQQIAELIHEKGIDFLGPLPPEIQKITVFSSGIHTGAKQPDAAKAFQTFLAAPSSAAVVKKNGMEPATPN
jgi:molybdate transport system substrate-binding protein